MSKISEVFHKASERSRKRNDRQGKLGKMVDAGGGVLRRVYDSSAGAVYVTLDTGTIVEAFKSVHVKQPLPVVVRKGNGRLWQIVGFHEDELIATFGDKAPYVTAPPISGDLQNDPVNSRRITFGLVHATGGGLKVRIKSFRYRWNGAIQRYPGGELNLVSNLPAVAAKRRWVAVVYDPATNTCLAISGTDYPAQIPIGLAQLDEIDVADYEPLAGVQLYSGQTTLTEADFEEARLWLASLGSGNVVDAEPRYWGLYNYEIDAPTGYKIGLATSSDGRSFIRQTEPLIDIGGSGTWDDSHVKDPCLVQGADGVLHLYYAGHDGSQYKIGLARSFDGGETWEKYASNPVLSAAGGWESTTAANVAFPTVIYDDQETNSSKKWKLWYYGGQYGAGGIGYAYSSDGLSWTKYASNPVVTLGSGGSWDDTLLLPSGCVRLGSTFYLFYSGSDDLAAPTWSVGMATFTNPESSYTKSADNPILVGDGKTTSITTDVADGDTTIAVTDATVFPIGCPVWIYNGSTHYLSQVTARPTTTSIVLADPAPLAVAASGGVVRSVAYNSIVARSVIYDGGWRVSITPFQPEDPSGDLRELSMVAYAKDLDDLFIDYQAGLTIPVAVEEGTAEHLSFENPWIFDRWKVSDRFLVAVGSGGSLDVQPLMRAFIGI
jgi:hypothetical protein